MTTRLLNFTAAALLGLAAGSTALAIQPTGANQPGTPGNTVTSPSRVERGGTVSAVDWRKRTLEVDNVAFPISASPVVVHGWLPRRGSRLGSTRRRRGAICRAVGAERRSEEGANSRRQAARMPGAS